MCFTYDLKCIQISFYKKSDRFFSVYNLVMSLKMLQFPVLHFNIETYTITAVHTDSGVMSSGLLYVFIYLFVTKHKLPVSRLLKRLNFKTYLEALMEVKDLFLFGLPKHKLNPPTRFGFYSTKSMKVSNYQTTQPVCHTCSY